MSPQFEIRMLGGFELRDPQGRRISLSVRKAEAVLALLAVEPGRALSRSKLCSMLWPNVPEAQARHSLRQALVSIRRLLPTALTATARTLALRPDAARVDTTELDGWLSDGSREALERAAQAYRGDLLDGIDSAEEPFEHWLTLERERIRAALLRGLCKLGELHASGAAWAEALEVCQHILQLDPLHEPAVRACMRALAQLGRRAEALQHYQKHARTLRQSLDVEPEPETQQLHASLSKLSLPAQPELAAAEPRSVAQSHASTAPLLAARADACSSQLRTPELAQLQAAFEAASSASAARLCLIEGEAGIGKSHLSGQLAQRLAAAGVRVLYGRCFESEQVLPFSCWSDLLGHAHLAQDMATLGSLPIEQRRELARLLPQLPDAAPLRAADDPSALFHALAAVIARYLEHGPVCLVLEDLHWSDEMSLRFLCYLVRRQPCFVLATARPEQRRIHDVRDVHDYLPRALAELEREHKLVRMPLAPFSFAQTCELARYWAQQLSLHLQADAWFERIWQLSEGNALVTAECVRALAQPEAPLDLAQLNVPERTRALIRQRVAGLSQSARELAAIAAVYGRELHLRLLAAFMDGPRLALALQELVSAQLLRSQQERLLFTHDRVRETLYDDMLPAIRRQLHEQIARALTPLAAGAVLGQAGYHYAKAGNPTQAIELLRRFSEHATRSHALSEALAALDEASRQAEQLEPRERASALTELSVRQAFCLAFLGRFEDMAQRLERHVAMAEQAETPQLTAAFHYWYGFSSMFRGRLAQAEKQATSALRFAAQSGDKQLLGVAHNLASHQQLLSARFSESLAHAEQALELLRTSERSEPLMFAYINLCIGHCVQGRTADALQVAAAAERAAQRTDSQRGVAMAALVNALAQLARHRWDLAITAAQRALAASQTPFTLGPACAMIVFAQLASGDGAGALPLIEGMLAQLGAEKPPLTLHVVFMLLHAEALLSAGALGRAEQLAAELVVLTREMGHVAHGVALRTLGLAKLRRGELHGARAPLEEALQYYEALGMPLAITPCLLALAELDRENALRERAWLQRAHAVYTSIDHAVGARHMLERLRTA